MLMDKSRIRDHFEKIADEYDGWKERNSYYYDNLKAFYRDCTSSEDRVIEFGCGTGDILEAANGKFKLGLDLAQKMVDKAALRHPDLDFKRHDCEKCYRPDQPFDVAILADVIDHITDILKVYENANSCLKVGGRMCISTINPLWDPLFAIAERLGLKMPEGEHNFVPNRYLVNFLRLRGFRFVRRSARLLIPKHIPLVSNLVNRIAPHIPLVNRFCVVQTIIAEKTKDYLPAGKELFCSVVVPCYNEEANVEGWSKRTPNMGKSTEIIVVDDGSTDKTAARTKALSLRDPRVKLVSYSPNRGKGHAVRTGFDAAKGDIIMILDADMTVMPEELPLFFDAVASGEVDFANGTRMIYPMEGQAMRFLNLMGNFCFGVILSYLIGHRISDSLCGTKALKRKDYANITMSKDKWGDFDLLFGAAENKLLVGEVPVHYMARTGGESKMRPFVHGLLLLKMCWIGFVRLKLFPLRKKKEAS